MKKKVRRNVNFHSEDELQSPKIAPRSSDDLDKTRGFTDLHSAAHKGDINAKAVLDILPDSQSSLKTISPNKQKKITAKDANGRTPLFYAIEHGHAKFASVLIESGAEVDIADNNGYYPMHLAAMQGQEESLKVLLTKGAKVSVKDFEERTPLFWSVYNDHPQCVKLLLDAGAEGINLLQFQKLTNSSGCC